MTAAKQRQMSAPKKALRVPAKFVIPHRLVLTPKSLARVLSLIRKPRKPTRAMRDLWAGKPLSNEPEDW